ncbi:unnamed protein product [Strongylus vulgaris]|uniref:Uncharacterized protein n=1 Tax=Strongylus vulgaris TaxID=40348 RepID=A0A3P7JS35_STRVU|nr:unnamed protein product [Strongylus vulgaris]
MRVIFRTPPIMEVKRELSSVRRLLWRFLTALYSGNSIQGVFIPIRVQVIRDTMEWAPHSPMKLILMDTDTGILMATQVLQFSSC